MKQLITIILIFCTVNWLYAQIELVRADTIPIGGYPLVCAIGDINNDGLNDIVVGTGIYTNPTNLYPLTVIEQNPQGGLNSPIEYYFEDDLPGIKSVEVADVNNDGLNDVVIAYGYGLGIFYQNEEGTLNAIQNIDIGGSSPGATCGDLNNDGLIDIAIDTEWYDEYIHVYYQTLSGHILESYSKPDTNIGLVRYLNISDLNGDGLNDLLFLTSFGDGQLNVQLQNNYGTLEDAITYYYEPGWGGGAIYFIAAGDVNNDNLNDVVASIGGNWPKSKLGFWYQDGNTNMLQNPPLIIDVSDSPQEINVEDLNCDGKNEIIIAHGNNSGLDVYEQDSSGFYNKQFNCYLPFQSHYLQDSYKIGDINNDGRKEIVFAHTFTGIIIYNNYSLPESYETISTINTTDTLNVEEITNVSNYVETSVNESGGYSITQTDIYKIYEHIKKYAISEDSVIIKEGVVCWDHYYDTTKFSKLIEESNLIKIDTFYYTTQWDSLNIASSIKIYPNPTKGDLIIELPGAYEKKELGIKIHNAWGQIIRNEINEEKSNRRLLRLYELPFGLYYISLYDRSKLILTKKIVKK